VHESVFPHFLRYFFFYLSYLLGNSFSPNLHTWSDNKTICEDDLCQTGLPQSRSENIMNLTLVCWICPKPFKAQLFKFSKWLSWKVICSYFCFSYLFFFPAVWANFFLKVENDFNFFCSQNQSEWWTDQSFQCSSIVFPWHGPDGLPWWVDTCPLPHCP